MTYPHTPIEDRDGAITYLRWLIDSPFIYHFDDDPSHGMQSVDTLWPNDLCQVFGERHKEMWQHINPWTWLEACPCTCGGLVDDHDDRGYGAWDCQACGNDSDTDLGLPCTSCVHPSIDNRTGPGDSGGYKPQKVEEVD